MLLFCMTRPATCNMWMEPEKYCFARRRRQWRDFLQPRMHSYNTQKDLLMRREYGVPVSRWAERIAFTNSRRLGLDFWWAKPVMGSRVEHNTCGLQCLQWTSQMWLQDSKWMWCYCRCACRKASWKCTELQCMQLQLWEVRQTFIISSITLTKVKKFFVKIKCK